MSWGISPGSRKNSSAALSPQIARDVKAELHRTKNVGDSLRCACVIALSARCEFIALTTETLIAARA
jgi:hypothetical protein